ncbi:MAG TPA: hypothetical protein VMU17_02880, partial [Elusimicrobiota bacterium]|nr:hypothetical protein [Elusimicrobiota bacterium]
MNWATWKRKTPKGRTLFKTTDCHVSSRRPRWGDILLPAALVLGVMEHARADVAPVVSTPTAVVAPALSAPTVATTTPLASTSTLFYIVHPTEGQKLPPLTQVFVFGAAPKGSTVTINGGDVHLSATGGFLTMVPVKGGDVLLNALAKTPGGEWLKVERHFSVAPGFTVSPSTPAVLESGSVSPDGDVILAPGDTLDVSFQGSPGGSAEFAVSGVAAHLPMIEEGAPASRDLVGGVEEGRGIYEGLYTIQPGDKASQSAVEVTLKKDRSTLKRKAAGKLTIDPGGLARVGVITDDTVAVRTGPEGGYDMFLYR